MLPELILRGLKFERKPSGRIVIRPVEMKSSYELNSEDWCKLCERMSPWNSKIVRQIVKVLNGDAIT